MIHKRTCALSCQIKGPLTVNWLFFWISLILASFTVMGPLIWYDSAQVRMWIILNINNNDFYHLGKSQTCTTILGPQNRTQGSCELYKRQCSTDSCLGWLHLQHLSHFWHVFIFHTDHSIVCVFLCQGSFGALIIGWANIARGAAANFAAEFLHVLKYCVLACVLHGVLGYCILSCCLFASKTLFSNLRSHD